ncbi:hypothetical protein C8R46DRAFT_1219743 [Mycena filopes]|nr:hypothetical protein C8R46DRAFT_1219743 [Mycena filopes]
MAPESTMGECTAHDDDSKEECDCVQYAESTDIPGYCERCYHRRRDHFTSHPGASKKNDRVQSLLAGLVGGSSSRDTKAGPSKPRASLASALAATGSKNKKTQSLFGAANRESNRGMRPTIGESENKGKKGKGKEPPKRDTFKVTSVQLLPCGTKRLSAGAKDKAKDELVRQLPKDFQSVPDRQDAQMAELHGLAVVKYKRGIVFDREADHEQVVEALTALLPLPFAYFARLQEEASDSDDQPVWYLAAIAKKKLVVVPSDRPDGSVLDYNKGSGTTGFRNISRDPIPEDILAEWLSTTSSVKRASSQDEEDTPMSDEDQSADSDEDESSLAEDIPLKKNKRRLVSRSSDEDGEGEKPSKKQKRAAKWSREPEILNDKIAREITGSSGAELIDLTSDEVRSSASTPDFLRPIPKSPPEAPASPGRPDEFDDSELGNPYDTLVNFEF